MAYRWALAAGLLCGAAALAVALAVHDVRFYNLTWLQAPVPGAVWLPTLTGIALAWVLTERAYVRDLDERTWRALRGHPIGSELTWLLIFLACFIGGSALLATVFGQLLAGVPFTPVVRVIFLFMLPILFVDRAGFTLTGYGAAMPAHVLRVAEAKRWLGVVPLIACCALAAVSVYPTSPPTPKLVILAAAVGFITVAIPEEVFFRSMLQSRLERLAGRWAGILLSSLLYALTYAVLGSYNEFSPLPEGELHSDVAHALLTYGVLGVLYGYVWVCYRNLWLNVALHGALALVVASPALLIL
ncbi:hypothetical protein GCM10009799_06690 [Nocardiopsis rhodophaea]|uniref:CAAX prenyl protease 2/Lysostaphin resistance protein A-like domain-containing protein n=1 Tax=Nocardiopsis rhodophaea TaxID=280238 RepID=A0ABN2SC44_9ACTN